MPLSAICGTDLHFIRATFTGTKEGRILGHEAIGIVEEVGKAVELPRRRPLATRRRCAAKPLARFRRTAVGIRDGWTKAGSLRGESVGSRKGILLNAARDLLGVLSLDQRRVTASASRTPAKPHRTSSQTRA